MRILLILFILFFCACSKNEQVTDIKTIVVNDTNEFDINSIISYNFISLETNDNCLISNIKQIKIIDNKIYINNDGNNLLVFDMSGKFITQIGNKGNGPGEYRLISNFHIDKKKGIFYIADGGQARIISYNFENFQPIKTEKIFYFIDCNWLADGNIAWYFVRGYESKDKDRYFIKITNQDLKELNLLYPLDIELLYPIGIGSPFYTLNKKCYLNLPHIPTIYEVTSSNIIPVYQLNLGIHKFAPQEWMEQEAPRDYSAIVNTDYISAQNIQETNDYICVGYCAKGANAYIGFYNKKSGKSCKYSHSEFIRHTGFTGSSIINSVYEDSFITILNASILKRNPHGKIPELNAISENINEEDNPVLCLFKLK